ncbi:MAG: peroxiredoxin [Candidatus Woesearchaeota archaeon]
MGEEIKYSMPLLGDEFPRFGVQTTHGKMTLPDDMNGSWFILFSHPGDFTPVCTTEFVAFQERKDDFDNLGCKLVGFSVDQVFAHIKWTEWIKDNFDTEIEFPIIADHGPVAKRLGMIHPGKGSNTVRAVFVVDPKGVLRTTLYYPQELGRNMDEIVRIVKALQTSDKNGVAMPANWPDNEHLGDSVIIPPASDVKTAKERMSDSSITCKDWWFCHKKL